MSLPKRELVPDLDEAVGQARRRRSMNGEGEDAVVGVGEVWCEGQGFEAFTSITKAVIVKLLAKYFGPIITQLVSDRKSGKGMVKQKSLKGNSRYRRQL